jgi:DNA-binding NarL/FixJ family response regulator
MANNGMIKAVIIEGNLFLREALVDIFRTYFPFIELMEAGDEKVAKEGIESFLPGIILIDVQLPGHRGLALARAIRDRCAEAVIVALSSFDFLEYQEAAYHHGADCFFSKEAPLEDFIHLIQSITPVWKKPRKNGRRVPRSLPFEGKAQAGRVSPGNIEGT